jgi:hypothetical protein
MFTEDLSVFLNLDGFGVPVVAGAVSGVGILDQNSEIILGGELTIIDYLLTVPTATFGGLTYGDLVTVNGVSYKVETQPQRFDDGAFCRVPLVPGVGNDPANPNLQGLEVRWDARATVIYRGTAPANSSEAATVWTIRRRTFSTAGVLLTTSTATGAWSNRTNLTYS